mgnify:FL=1
MTVVTRTILARHRWPGKVLRPARCWVMHDMEAPERSNIAEGVGNYFKTTTRTASTHYGIDNDSVVRYAYDNDKVAAAYGLNSDSIHIEHAGYARQIRSEWLDPYGTAMLELSARLFVEQGMGVHRIPFRILSARETANRSMRGITSHLNSTRGWGVRGGHTDPGDNFPWDYFAERIQAHIGGGALTLPPLPKVPDRVLKRPMRGAEVADWQKKLNKVLSYELDVDGQFGPKTHTATIVFQRDAKITVDGIVGPQTRKTLKAYVEKKKKVKFKLVPFSKKSPKKAVTPYPGKKIKEGDHGPDVRKVQQWLYDHGMRIAVDGWFGPKTHKAVRRFEKANGFKADGIVGRKLWKRLSQASAV